ncbi:MAG: flagellar M-ring protein FliF [Oscillospiraceae bacterium]|nr:flagellar M-ring protein FliF [Oscillospiraceae bacterium]
MNERIKKVTTVVKEKWSGFSTAIKVMLIAIPVVLIAIIIILANILNHKNEAELYTGLNTQEAAEIVTAIENMGIQGAKLSGGTITVPSDQVDYLRMQLAVQGYPNSSPDYKIWQDGINLWSTDSDKRVVAKQQMEARISATLRQLKSVTNATTNLSIPEEKQYSIKPDSKPPTASVQLMLSGSEQLKNSEVRAIFDLIAKAVEGLTYENISLTDTQGHLYNYISAEEEAAMNTDPSGVNVARKRFTFEREMEQYLLQDLKDMLTDIYGPNGFAINVKSRLNFDNKKVTSIEYFPSGDENTGVKHHELHIDSNIGLVGTNGLVGFTPNADTSPDYPSVPGLDEGEEYYYKKDEIEYDVTQIKTEIEKDGYSIDSVSVGVTLNLATLTERDREIVTDMVAHSAGTTRDKVTVYNTVFPVGSGNQGGTGPGISIISSPVDSYRNMLLMLVIALGVILVILLIVSLFMSKSRKKKIRRRQELALAAAQAAAENDLNRAERETPQEVDFNIASLTQEAGKESRETILKREIAEFARTSPEIVASIIRNMLREEN